MRIEQVMSRDVRSVGPVDRLDQAARIMWEHDCGCVPVVDGGGRALAMLTDRDICMAAYTQGRTLAEIPVASAMSRQLYGCGPMDDLAVAQQVMHEHKVRRLPVLGFEGQLLGLVSLSDLVRAQERARPRGRAEGAPPLDATLAAITTPHRVHVAPAL